MNLKHIKGRIRYLFTYYWYLFVVIGFSLIFLGLLILSKYNNDVFMSVFFTLGLGMISFGIACYSIRLADDTDRKISMIINDEE